MPTPKQFKNFFTILVIIIEIAIAAVDGLQIDNAISILIALSLTMQTFLLASKDSAVVREHRETKEKLIEPLSMSHLVPEDNTTGETRIERLNKINLNPHRRLRIFSYVSSIGFAISFAVIKYLAPYLAVSEDSDLIKGIKISCVAAHLILAAGTHFFCFAPRLRRPQREFNALHQEINAAMRALRTELRQEKAVDLNDVLGEVDVKLLLIDLLTLQIGDKYIQPSAKITINIDSAPSSPSTLVRVASQFQRAASPERPETLPINILIRLINEMTYRSNVNLHAEEVAARILEDINCTIRAAQRHSRRFSSLDEAVIDALNTTPRSLNSSSRLTPLNDENGEPNPQQLEPSETTSLLRR